MEPPPPVPPPAIAPVPPVTTTPTPTSTITATTTSVAATATSTIPPPKTSSYPDSMDSSPRSRNTDSWEDPPNHTNALGSSKLRLMCSYGGHIVPRPHDKSLCYVGGDTRIVVVDRNINLSSLSSKLSHTFLNDRSFNLKYQLPSEDLDSLISVTTDEDLENMVDEYDRTTSGSNSSHKPSRIRLFLFPLKPESSQSIPILESSTKSDDWFLDALNGAGLMNRGYSDSESVNCLLGLDDVVANRRDGGESGGNLDLGARDTEGLPKSAKHQQQQQPGAHDVHSVHSVPDSPMVETTSSFGSTSSLPSLVNLPQIQVRTEEGGGAGVRVHDQRVGIEEQFAQMSAGVAQKQQDEGFMVMPATPPMPNNVVVPGTQINGAGEYQSRVNSDDERSDHGVPVGYRKPPTPHSQSQPQIQPHQTQQKPSGGYDLPSPDSVSSDNSMNKPLVYQDPNTHIPYGTTRVTSKPVDTSYNVSDSSTRVHIQEPSYVLQPQFDQPQQKQFIHGGAHYISHHPPGAVQMPTYYQVYSPQQQPIHHRHPQLDQHYPVYYMPVRQPQAYNLSMQQSSITEATQPQTPPNPALVPPPTAIIPMRNAPVGQPELPPAGVYRTTTQGGPQLVQVPANQQQYVGYSQIHHPAQSVNPTPSATANYAYEYVDPAHAQMYYTRGPAPTIPSQYQTMTPATARVLPEGSAQISSENIKQQI